MNRNERFVITINRQFGTGGHEIGRVLAETLGVKLIDRQVLQKVARQFNLTEDEAERLEQRRPSWWEDFTKLYRNFVRVNEPMDEGGQVTSRQLFYAQAKAMEEIAGQESCVIIGRCGFHIFREHPNALRIFLHSAKHTRVTRIMDRYHVDAEKARMMIEDNDYLREIYTKTYTGCGWYDVRNYDLTLDVGGFGVNGAVETLLSFIG